MIRHPISDVRRLFAEGFTEDTLLGGVLTLRQPRTGYRVTSDSVLLAALTPLQPHQRVLDLGTGYGQVGLCLLAREPTLQVTGVELLPDVAALAVDNARRNGFSDPVTVVCASVADPSRPWGGGFDVVVTNPPYRTADSHTPSPHPLKAAATVEDPGAPLPVWVGAAARALREGGRLVMIHDTRREEEILAALRQHGFGPVEILPLAPKKDRPARREVFLAPLSGEITAHPVRHPPLVLHGDNGHWSQAVDAALRGPATVGPFGSGLITTTGRIRM